MAFGERLRDLRHERGWSSQEAFARHVGLDRTYISGLERSRRNPTLDVIVKLAHALDVKPADLLATIE
ncbi:helix-turn-helix domain-containing protein [Tsukamurella tyrosinosolvens]|uniref:helix-turn-helix domain-containing protein n=1 Tax=Tsukamurella tyrosinosolvens TaxID=57704 RepID=UPI0018D3E369|nr:helix-turn-helix transcriptional regulator [Tsukamurella tyrosinosolvens]